LEGLAEGRDPVLRDLAADVLAGRLSLAEVVATSEALPRLQQAIDQYAAWRGPLSDAEFGRLIMETQATLAELSRGLAPDGETDA
jgi:hypothetical protein